MRIWSLFLLLILFSASCTKKETIYETDHQNVVIPGNVPPPAFGVTTLQLHNYVNKLYIDFLGREASQIELDDATQDLKAGGLGLEARELLITGLQLDPVYYQRFWAAYSGQILLGITFETIDEFILVYYLLYDQAIDEGDTLLAQIILREVQKMEALRAAPEDYAAGLISINTYLGYMVNNLFFDEINMGTENMVLACFEQLFKRNPTEAELQAGITMVDGLPAQLLLRDGNSRNDFVGIMTSVPEFYQGLVIDIYTRLLRRQPTSVEVADGIQLLSEGGTYQILQRQVALSAEYAGF